MKLLGMFPGVTIFRFPPSVDLRPTSEPYATPSERLRLSEAKSALWHAPCVHLCDRIGWMSAANEGDGGWQVILITSESFLPPADTTALILSTPGLIGPSCALSFT